MKTSFYYIAVNDNNEGFICEAFSKKQMRNAQINMGLSWERYESYEKALNILKCDGVKLKNASNVTNFK